MKRFIVSTFCVSVFCIGLGAIVENVGARFKSDEKALALIKQARIAIGGEQSIADVRSMVIKGVSTHTYKHGTETRTNAGETEIAVQLPDKLSKRVTVGRHDDAVIGDKVVSEKHDVIIMRGEGHGEGAGVGVGSGEKKVFVRKADGNGGNVEIEKIVTEGKNGELTTSDGKKVIVRTVERPEAGKIIIRSDKELAGGDKIIVGGDKRVMHMRTAGDPAAHSAVRQNELLRLTLSLLLTAPEGMDVSYTFVGEGDVDGTTCNIVNANFAGSDIKLYLSKASSLPVMVSYKGHEIPRVMSFTAKVPEGGAASSPKENVIFTHKVEPSDTVEMNVRFSDYRGANGVQLPYKWTTSVGERTTEVFDVTGYELNPANIAEKFQNQKVMVRTPKETN